MKIKKIQLLRPKFELVSERSPIIVWLYFVFVVLPQLIKVKRGIFDIEIKSPIHKYAGTVYKHNVWFICIPKIKVVKPE